MALLELRDITAGYYPGPTVVSELSLSLEAGGFLGIIGPNGSGKTTLLRVAAGVLRPATGDVRLDGQPVEAWARRRLARFLAVVPQISAPPFAFSVREYVALGRTPYVAPWARLTAGDVDAVARALATAGLEELAARPVTELSGGEFQRANLARALAQEPRLVLLDEPTSFLDPTHSVHILGLLERLNAEGLTVVAIFHDLNLAGAYCREIYAIKRGRHFASGTTEEVLRAEVLEGLYETPLVVETGPHGRPSVTLMKVDGRHADQD